MRLDSKRPVMIFAKNYEGRMLYSLGLNKQDMNGTYINGYMSCRFRKDVNVPDKSKIQIKDGWLDFYLKDKKTMPYIFINEFEYVEDEKPKEEPKDEFELDDSCLPF